MGWCTQWRWYGWSSVSTDQLLGMGALMLQLIFDCPHASKTKQQCHWSKPQQYCDALLWSCTVVMTAAVHVIVWYVILQNVEELIMMHSAVFTVIMTLSWIMMVANMVAKMPVRMPIYVHILRIAAVMTAALCSYEYGSDCGNGHGNESKCARDYTKCILLPRQYRRQCHLSRHPRPHLCHFCLKF